MVYYKGVPYEQYQIDEDGNIYSLKRKKFLCPTLNHDGYLNCRIFKNGKGLSTSVARIMAYTFLGLPPKTMSDPTVDHIDGNRINNHVTNLRWLPRAKNASTRLYKKNSGGKGEHNVKAKLNNEQVIHICELLTDINWSYTQIAQIIGASKGQVGDIAIRQTWTHISKNYTFPDRSKKILKNPKEELGDDYRC